MKHNNLSYFAQSQAYGEGDYGANLYSCTTQQQAAGTCTAATSGPGSSGSNSGLADTGIAVALFMTVACFIIFVSILVRAWRRKPQPVIQEVDDISSDGTSQPNQHG